MVEVDNLYENLGGYFKLFFIMTDVGNLYKNIEDYFELSFVMAEVGNLDAKYEVTLCIFYMAVVGNFLINCDRSNGYYQ
jgi:hypothetical protein